MTLSKLLYFIEHKTSTLINIDALHPAFYASGSMELAPEQHLHRGPFCEFAKRYGRDGLSCVANKSRSRLIAVKGRPFKGACPYGVWELAWPVMVAKEHAATIYLGHLSSGTLTSTIGGSSYDGPALPQAAQIDQGQLHAYAAFVVRFIEIEIGMWLVEGRNLSKQKPGAFYRDFCLQYIECNYRDPIQLRDLASALKMSPNYVSSQIKRECKRTFSELLNQKRLAVACTHLEFDKTRSITDIAYMCGFRDSNYFSTAFRKHIGVTPRAYRQQWN